ncbi:hypothetical protein IQ07DRAFT_565504 [Pyrenochaeta sp. DS3sAY3a]|nr:hypothetical protein IQ07DRAFT_565504 [Pyrenochaeta sp. DS3sAY3a]
MPSQEAQILSDFLLAPAPLRDFVTLRQFTDIFPQSQRTNPAIKDLYRELQRLREKDIESVRRSIAEEVRRSKRLRQEYAKERRQLDGATFAGLDPVAFDMEQEISGQFHAKPHTLQTIHTSVQEACQSLETQIEEIEEENRRALAEVQEVVGALSDLRHGKFPQSATANDLGEEVLATLKRLETVCTNPAKD